MGLIVFPLLPPPASFSSFVFQYCLLSSPSWFVFVDIVLLSCVDHPMGAVSSMARSSPKVAGAIWGHQPQHWSQLGPAGPLAVPTWAQVPVQSPQPTQSSSRRAQRGFGKSLRLHLTLAITLCSRHCVSWLPPHHRSLGYLSLNPSTTGGQILP